MPKAEENNYKRDDIFKFHAIIDQLVMLNKVNRKRNDHLTDSMPPAYFAREFCTVSCNIGRQTGKTEYVKLHATDQDIVIVSSTLLRELHKGAPYRVIAPYEILDMTRGSKFCRYENIYIEEPTYVAKDVKLSDIYRELVVDSGQTFILLGE
jgi:hypothetical protein